MAKERVGTGDRRRAGEYERAGLQAYKDWDIDRAIQSFQAAVNVAPKEPQYVLYLAQALTRSGDFDQALRALAEATLNESKSADGLQSVRWFRQGEIDKVIEYCQHDVEITRRLYEHGQEHGHVLYWDRQGRIQKVYVNWP